MAGFGFGQGQAGNIGGGNFTRQGGFINIRWRDHKWRAKQPNQLTAAGRIGCQDKSGGLHAVYYNFD